MDGIPSSLAASLDAQTTNPASGSEVPTTTVPDGKYWWLKGVSVSLVQGLTQTPQPILVVDDGTNIYYEMFGSSAAQGASTTCRYSWGIGLPLTGQVGSGANIHSTAPLPDSLVIPGGGRILTSTLGIGANTDYGVATLYIVEYG